MIEQEEEFLFRAIIRQENYSIISIEMKVDRKTLSRWWDDLKAEREELSAIRQLWRSKLNNQELVKDTFKIFHSWYSSTHRELPLLWYFRGTNCSVVKAGSGTHQAQKR